ncbi:hypothetical protein Tco_1007008 [Tanacetum coccineum]|uniref:Uncharacterized protein n=1 Tax=Tanacetum coccineum TaxID=301880 RepID=A0ABQ5FJJ9_9ASTR
MFADFVGITLVHGSLEESVGLQELEAINFVNFHLAWLENQQSSSRILKFLGYDFRQFPYGNNNKASDANCFPIDTGQWGFNDVEISTWPFTERIVLALLDCLNLKLFGRGISRAMCPTNSVPLALFSEMVFLECIRIVSSTDILNKQLCRLERSFVPCISDVHKLIVCWEDVIVYDCVRRASELDKLSIKFSVEELPESGRSCQLEMVHLRLWRLG